MDEDEVKKKMAEQTQKAIDDPSGVYKNEKDKYKKLINEIINSLRNDDDSRVYGSKYNDFSEKLKEIKNNETLNFINMDLIFELYTFFKKDNFLTMKVDRKKRIIQAIENWNIKLEISSVKKDIEIEERLIKLKDLIENETNGVGENLDNTVSDFLTLLNNLNIQNIKGIEAGKQLNNFIVIIGPILVKARNMESNNENSFMVFKKYIDELKSMKPTNPVLIKQVSDFIKTCENGFNGLDGTLMEGIRNIKNKFNNETDGIFKDEKDLSFYLFDKLEDVIKTPPRTVALLKGLESEARNLKIKELNEKTKEIDELKIKFRNLISYFKNNFKSLKVSKFNESIINQYLKDAFDGLEKIDDVNKLQEAFKLSIDEFDKECDILYKKILISRDKEDMPIYEKALKFITNVVDTYILMHKMYVKEFYGEIKNNELKNVYGGDFLTKTLGNPEEGDETGKSGEWIKRMDDCLNITQKTSEILQISNKEIAYFKTKIEDIKKLIQSVSDFSETLVKKGGIKEIVESKIKFSSTKQQEQETVNKLNEGKVKFSQDVNLTLQKVISKPKKILKEISAKDKEIEKIQKNNQEQDDQRIEELQEFDSELKKYADMINKLIELIDILKNNIQVAQDEKSTLKIINSYENLINYYFEIYNFLQKLNNEIIPMVEFIIKNHDTLLFYYGGKAIIESSNTIKTQLKTDLNEIKTLLSNIISNKNKGILTQTDSRAIKNNIAKKEFRDNFEKNIKPKMREIQDYLSNIDQIIGGIQ